MEALHANDMVQIGLFYIIQAQPNNKKKKKKRNKIKTMIKKVKEKCTLSPRTKNIQCSRKYIING